MGWRGQVYPGQYINLPPDTSERIGPLSGVSWCDIDDKETNVKGQVGHPMSTKDPDRRHFTQTANARALTGNSYGTPTYQESQEVTEVIDVCGYHWRKQNLFQAPEPSALESAEVEAAKAEAKMWRTKYEADHIDE